MKKIMIAPILLFFALIGRLAGCYETVRTPEQLLEKAKSEYGNCTLISQNQKEEYSEIYVEDDAQHFEYSVYCHHTNFIDGGLNTYSIYDNFKDSYCEYVKRESQTSFDDIVAKYGVTYEVDTRSILIIDVCAEDEASGLAAANEMLEELQKYKYKNRMDEAKIYVLNTEGGSRYKAKNCFGQLSVKTGEYENTKEKLIEYYTKEITLRVGPNIKFVEVEYGVPIAETGAEWQLIKDVTKWENDRYSISEGEYCDCYTFKTIPFGTEYKIYSFEYVKAKYRHSTERTYDSYEYYLVRK